VFAHCLDRLHVLPVRASNPAAYARCGAAPDYGLAIADCYEGF
jgi:hypothetical protein